MYIIIEHVVLHGLIIVLGILAVALKTFLYRLQIVFALYDVTHSNSRFALNKLHV